MTLADLAEITDRLALADTLEDEDHSMVLADLILQNRLLEATDRALDDRIQDLILENRELRAAIVDADADLTRFLEDQRQLVARVEQLERTVTSTNVNVR